MDEVKNERIYTSTDPYAFVACIAANLAIYSCLSAFG
jgi:hypothetical protein